MSAANQPGNESGNCHETLANLMEQMVRKENLSSAYNQVVGNKGSAGVDGLGVHEMKAYLEVHWEKIKVALLTDNCYPQPVRKVEIPKPKGASGC